MSTLTGQAVSASSQYVDDRFGSSNFIRRSFNKIFPDHWSFMLGEIALFSFIILLLTGTYLTFFYEASLEEVVYEGSYAPLRGQEMTKAFVTTLDISFDVKGGLLIRQIHHWAALLFVASIVVHLMRVFFTGAFRKPREINWVIGVGLLTLALAEGFAGYSLPDDLLSGTGLRIAWSIMLSIPVVGTWVAFLVFGGEYPGEVILGRLYVLHILLLPGVLVALISAHMMILWHQKHTQFRGPGRTEHNVVGSRLFPVYTAKAGGFFFLVFAVCALLGGLAQINPIWLYGPYDASDVSAGSQPDWYIGWLDGALRLMPAWEFRGFGYTIPIVMLFPSVILPGIIFTLMALYPFLEQKFSGDREYHNLLDRPRDKPVRTGIGAMSLTFYVVLWISGGNDVIAAFFGVSLNAMTWAGRIALIVLPPLAYYFTHRICLGLQKADADRYHHGIETGVIRRLPSGEFIEVHAPMPEPTGLVLAPVEPDHGRPGELEPASNVGGARSDGHSDGHSGGNGHRASGDGQRRSLVSSAGRAVSGFFVAKKDDPEVPPRQPSR